MIKFVLILIIIALVFGGGFYLINNPGKLPFFNSKSGQEEVMKQDSAQVQITPDGFLPETIKVKKGGQLTFINKDETPHWVASDPHPTHTGLPGLDSKALRPGDSWSFTFDKTGTFGFHDHLNPLKLKGSVIVE